ncbi:ABC transporter permease [Rhizobium sp. BR 315]|uniref:ABC transporter permease n=1 Tax=Rhizobium sp. BR 315 TaxID=3040014 RepID=UPI003D332695
MKSRKGSKKVTTMNLYRDGVAELKDGIKAWRIWYLLGTADLRRRHSRSRVGQLWITLSTGMTILALGLVWSLLWRMPVSGILPYIAVAMVFWAFITGVLNEATTAFSSMGNMFLNQKTSFSVAIYAVIYRNLIYVAYNLIIVVLTFAWYARLPTASIVLLIPGMSLTLLFLISVAYILAIVATRYRDAVPLTLSLTQIGYFVTPVLWRPEFIPENYRWLNSVNPFSVFLSLLRDPLLGEQIPREIWCAAVVYTVAAILLALPIIGNYNKRVIYWI